MATGANDPGSAPSAGEATGPLIVSLADLIAGGRLEWYEAVAIAQSLCKAIFESADYNGPSTVDAANVFLGSGGSVMAVPGLQSPATAVPRVAKILGDLLPDFHRRSTFHEVLSAATSSPPAYASLEEFSNALAAFERPNRAEIIRGVHQRWRTSAASPVPAHSGTLDRLTPQTTTATVATPFAPKATPAAPKQAAVPKSTRPRLKLSTPQASALAGIVAIIVGFVVWGVRAGQRTAIPVAPDASQATDGTSDANGTQSVGSKPTAVPAPRVAPVNPAASKQSAGQRPSTPTPVARSATGTTPTVITRPPDSTATAASGAGDDSPSVPPTVADSRIYSTQDLDVVPPIVNRPQQLWRMSGGAQTAPPVSVMVVVNERGTVESAQAMQPQNNLGDAMAVTMSLSAVKTWHFSPALRNGVPVKYRQIVSVTLR